MQVFILLLFYCEFLLFVEPSRYDVVGQSFVIPAHARKQALPPFPRSFVLPRMRDQWSNKDGMQNMTTPALDPVQVTLGLNGMYMCFVLMGCMVACLWVLCCYVFCRVDS